MSELFGLKWNDIDFRRNEISVTRSIVFQVVGPCKTEASQKPVPLDSRLAEALKLWRDSTKYGKAEDWVFASPVARGKRPYWGQCLMRTIIRPAAAQNGHQTNPRIASSRVQSRNLGHVYPSSHSAEATSPEQVSFDFCRRRLQLQVETGPWSVFLLCAFSKGH